MLNGDIGFVEIPYNVHYVHKMSGFGKVAFLQQFNKLINQCQDNDLVTYSTSNEKNVQTENGNLNS